MLLRDRDGLEVLMMRRSDDAPFAPGASVFPGGALDPGDHEDRDPALRAILTGVDGAAADRLLGVEGGSRAYWVAAIRECIEEVGVTLAAGPDGERVRADDPFLETMRRRRADLDAGAVSLASLYADGDMRLPLHDLTYVARWITPAVSPRRYDARFFVAAMPEGQEPEADGFEAVDIEWNRPAAVLDAWSAGTVTLIRPTVASLSLLCRFEGVADAIAGLRAAQHSGRRLTEHGGGVRVALAGEPTDGDVAGVAG